MKTLTFIEQNTISSTPNHVYFHFLGKNRQQIKHLLKQQSINFVEFVHWLAIPTQGLLLQFDKQHCIKITDKILL